MDLSAKTVNITYPGATETHDIKDTKTVMTRTVVNHTTAVPDETTLTNFTINGSFDKLWIDNQNSFIEVLDPGGYTFIYPINYYDQFNSKLVQTYIMIDKNTGAGLVYVKCQGISGDIKATVEIRYIQ